MITKNKLPEPLVGYKAIGMFQFFEGTCELLSAKFQNIPKDLRVPAALVALPRELKPGETLDVRIVKKKPARKRKQVEPIYSKVDGAIQRLELEEAEKRARARKRNAAKKARRK